MRARNFHRMKGKRKRKRKRKRGADSLDGLCICR